MIFDRDKIIYNLKKEVKQLKQTLNDCSEKNALYKTENDLYRNETVKKDQLING